MLDVLTRTALVHLIFPPTPQEWVLALKWAPTVIISLLLLIALLMVVVRRQPPGDTRDGRAPAWFRLLQAGVCIGVMQAAIAIILVEFAQADAFAQSDLTAQYPPRIVVLLVALVGLLGLFPYSHNSVELLARGQARLRAPFGVPVIGLLTPTEARVCTAYGRLTWLSWFLTMMLLLPASGVAGVLALVRLTHAELNYWSLILPFFLCWAVFLLAFLKVSAARRRLNHRSLAAYCQELTGLGEKLSNAQEMERHREGEAFYIRVADLADAVGTEKLLRLGTVPGLYAVADAQLALAQQALESGGAGARAATEYVVAAVAFRDLKGGEWLGLGWLLASVYVPDSLLRDRARYGHLLLNYCRAWLAAQHQLQRNTPLTAGMKTNVRLGLVVDALEQRVCGLAPAGEPAQAGAGGPAPSDLPAPWRGDTFLADLAARPDLPLLLALNEAVLQLDANLSWARVNAGLCRLAQGDAALARGHLEVAAAQRPDDPSLSFYRAVAYAREQQSSEALALLEEVTLADVGWFPAVRMYSETLLEVCQTPLSARLTSLADQPISAERWTRALAIISHALSQDSLQSRLQMPGAAPIYIAAGMAELFGRAQPSEAALWFRRALSVGRQHPQAWYGLALAAWEQRTTDAALQAAQETLRAQPQHIPAAALAAQVLLQRGQMDLAWVMADEALRLLAGPQGAQLRVIRYPRFAPEREVLLRVKGRVAFEQGRFAEAFQALDQVVRRYVDARFFAACALYHLGRYAEASERLKDYLASKEGAQDGQAYLYLGCALHAQGKGHQRAALNALDDAVKLTPPGSPERLRALLERGQVYEEREQLDLASQDYEAALEMDESPVTRYVLASLYYRLDHDEQALALLDPLVGQAAASPPGLAGAQPAARPMGAVAADSQAGALNTVVPGEADQPLTTQIQRLHLALRARLASARKQPTGVQPALAATPSLEPADQAPPAPPEQPAPTPEPASPAQSPVVPEEQTVVPLDEQTVVPLDEQTIVYQVDIADIPTQTLGRLAPPDDQPDAPAPLELVDAEATLSTGTADALHTSTGQETPPNE